MTDLDLPDEVLEAMGDKAEEDADRYSALCQVVSRARDDAVKARKESGIEDVWMRAEQAYLGVDEVNAGEFGGARWAKPTSSDGPLTNGDKKKLSKRSTAFIRLTTRYVDAGTAKMQEILLPIDDKAFKIESTPVPEMADQLDNEQPVMDATTGQPMMAMQPDGTQAPATVKDVIQQQIEAATKAAEKAERRIADWMAEAKHVPIMRRVIHDAARIGAGVLKAPFPVATKDKRATKVNGGIALEIVERVVPGEKWVDPWNLFPDPACGEDIHSGDFIIERDHVARKTLKALKGAPGYISSAIDRVLAEDADQSQVEPSPHDRKITKSRYEVWYFYGQVSKDDLISAQCIGVDDLPDDVQDCYAIITMVNNTIIKATLNPLDSGEFPFHVIPWQRRVGFWAGVGVAEQCFVPQRIVNAATRRMLDNGGISSGSQIIMHRGVVVPGDGDWSITPDKVWFMQEDTSVNDVRQAFMSVQIPNMQGPLMAIIEYGFKLAEESTSIPLITQGQSGKTTPDTFSGQQLQDNNANQLLRSIAANFDDCITEPVVNQYYEWLLLDPNIPEEEKGDYKIVAHGSGALVERAIQDLTLQQMGNMVGNPIFGIDPKRWFVEMAKSKRLNPANLQYTEAELKQIEKQQAQAVQQGAPQVQAAQIRAQADLQVAQMRAQTDQLKVQVDTDRDTAYNESLANRDLVQQQNHMADLQLRRELAMMEYANRHQLKLEDVKARLADTAMKLNMQKELTSQAQAVDLHKHNTPQVAQPAVEIPGRAEPGQAFTQ